ncbi:cation-transporting P-type ATPase [Corallincola platygyrae]|uniref:Cation-transporting P-type ATPase n=1 Tax=Corallincola platygyrae TaxID=1193278 RepID=A0ABW4XKG5_9GAMM
MKNNWFNKTTKETLQALNSSNEGLLHEEVAQRQQQYGKNELQENQGKTPLELFLHQFKNPLILILAIGALVSFATGHLIDAIAISAIILINAGIAFWQELKAQKSMQALKDMAAPMSLVIRNGEVIDVPASELVPGDMLKIQTGDILAADVRILEAHNLNIDEAALTGESEPVEKHAEALQEKEIPLGDQNNMGFMTTIVTSGHGLGVVTGTGMQTEVGHIADLMSSTEEVKTPMQVRMDTIAKSLMFVALGVVAVVAGIGLFYGMAWLEVINTSISLSVAAIPEGLPTIVSIVLTMGSVKMAKSNALARQLSAIETLGSTTVICSDKTGTLTQNQMQVMKSYDGAGRYWNVSGEGFDLKGEFQPAGHQVPANESLEMMMGLTVASLCNDAEHKVTNGESQVRGNPTEGALLVAAAKVELDLETLTQKGYQVIKKFPFDSARKMASVIVKDGEGNHFLAAKGAPDVMLNHASGFMADGKVLSLSPQVQGSQALATSPADECVAGYHQAIDQFANDALRTLAVGFRELDESQLDKKYEELEKDLTLLGLFGIMDPPRPEVRQAIEDCFSAGIRTVMITGDHALTAAAIARDIGIIRSDDDKVVTGAELDQMDDDELYAICPNVAVFARVTPEHKLRIVKAQQHNNEVASMTGDGVNDAPALRRADIGVAMGITGTSVAKDSSDLILLDDNFSTIVKAVRQGRQIFDNLCKFIRQALTANVGEVSVILFAFLLMGPEMVLPLTPLMILWINLVSDGLPALALGVEPEEQDLMERQPRKRNASFFGNHLGSRIVCRGLALGGASYLAFSWSLGAGHSEMYAQTVAFAMLIFAQLWHLFDSRTFTTLFRKNPFTNKYLLGAVALSAGLSLGVIYTSMGQAVFMTEALQLTHLLGIALAAALPTFLLSGVKEVTKIKWL